MLFNKLKTAVSQQEEVFPLQVQSRHILSYIKQKLQVKTDIPIVFSFSFCVLSCITDLSALLIIMMSVSACV